MAITSVLILHPVSLFLCTHLEAEGYLCSFMLTMWLFMVIWKLSRKYVQILFSVSCVCCGST